MTLLHQVKEELFSGWKSFEVFWLILFLAAQIVAYILTPDSLLAMISGIAGVICVVFVGKGKISNYLFGLIFAYTYFYVAWRANFIGEMNSVLYIYLPAQFIGYFMWKANLHQDTQGNQLIEAKALTKSGWLIVISAMIIGTFLLTQALTTVGGRSAGLDGLTTMITFTAQLLMILRYREQWLLWILLNVLSIKLWAETPAMYLMYSAYLLNSLYGYYNWIKLTKHAGVR